MVVSPISEEIVKTYYFSNLVKLDSIPDLKFRHFRFRLFDGSFYKIKRKIRDPSDLKECLVDMAPMDVYYSTACWLNPHLIASRIDKDILRNVIISCDLSFDIDVGKRISNLDEARHQAIAMNDFLASKGFKVRYSAFSGSKGFHIVCDDPWKSDSSELAPLKREMKAIDERKRIVQEAREGGITFDEKVTVDTRRIIRLPGTINSKTGFLCTVISKSVLESNIETILKLATCDITPAPRIPPRMGEMTALSAYKISGLLGRLGVRPKPVDNLCYSTFYTNNIPGTRLKIPILEFEGWMKKEKVFSIVGDAQNHYKLGDIFVFGDGEKYWAVSLKAVSQRRVEKILAYSGSMNLNQCRKYGCTYIRVGKSIGINGEVIQSEPKLLKVIEADINGQISRTHYDFFSSLGIKHRKMDVDFCGSEKEKLEIVHAIVE